MWPAPTEHLKHEESRECSARVKTSGERVSNVLDGEFRNHNIYSPSEKQHVEICTQAPAFALNLFVGTCMVPYSCMYL